MPCYEVRTVSVEFKVANKVILELGLQSLRLPYTKLDNMITVFGVGTINLELRKATILDGQQSMFNQIKQAYSREAVKTAAKRFAWATKTQGNNITVNKVRW